MRLITLAALALIGCDPAPSPPNTAPGAPQSAALSAAPSSEPAAAPASEAQQPAPAVKRRARFKARPNIQAPPELPKRWRGALEALENKAESISVSRRSGDPAWQTVHLRLRTFGLDTALTAEVQALLRGADLQDADAPLPTEPVIDGATTWSLDIGHLVAPKGEARGHRVELDWRHVPPVPANPADCRKPAAVNTPADAPRWLQRAIKQDSTRRLVGYEVNRHAGGRTVQLLVWFHNGYAQDAAVKRIVDGAKAAGLAHLGGEGPRQTWFNRARGTKLTWRPERGELHLGCAPKGPVISLDFFQAQQAAPKP
jgi:hypothetical protein